MSSHRTSPVRRSNNKLSRSTLFYYGIGSVAFGVKDNGFAFYLAALLCLLGYNISREQHTDNLKRLIQMHAERIREA